MNKIIMATNNKGKIEELKKMINGYDIYSQEDIGIENLDVNENGSSFEENAIIKAKSIIDLVDDGDYVIGEDSGICIEALNGYPGIKTKRAAQEELNRKVTKDERNKYILDKMKNESNRKVIWYTVIALIDKDRIIKTFTGQVEGKIAIDPKGDNGFGFDPIFYIDSENKTLAQMSFDEKEKYSARKRAIDKLNKYLKEKIKI